MRSFDQFSNVVLEDTYERRVVIPDDESQPAVYGDVPLGLYVIRGDSVVLLVAGACMLGIEVLEVKFMGSGRRLRRIYRVPACPRHRGVYACGSAPRAAGKAPVGSATSCSPPPKARRHTERRSYATDTCACTSGATGAASQGKHPTLGRGQQQHATAATS